MICPSCGGDYADWARTCPYCGTVNEAVDEKVYMEHMEQLRQRLDHVDEESEHQYRRHMLGNSRQILILVGILVLIAVSVGAWSMAVSYQGNVSRENKAVKQQEWEKEEYPKLDAWYEAGEYEKILQESYSLLKTPYNIYGWPHYTFVGQYYSAQKDCLNLLEQAKNGEEYSEYDLIQGVASGLILLYEKENGSLERQIEAFNMNGRYGITEEEAEIIRNDYRKTAKEMFDVLGWTSEECEDLYEICTETGYFRMQPCREAIRKGRK